MAVDAVLHHVKLHLDVAHVSPGTLRTICAEQGIYVVRALGNDGKRRVVLIHGDSHFVFDLKSWDNLSKQAPAFLSGWDV
jgi:hypothetical protein